MPFACSFDLVVAVLKRLLSAYKWAYSIYGFAWLSVLVVGYPWWFGNLNARGQACNATVLFTILGCTIVVAHVNPMMRLPLLAAGAAATVAWGASWLRFVIKDATVMRLQRAR